ncbi:MAG: hypothetical protein AAB834_00560, partial [Patescibacteria group bacterium]
MAIFNGEQAYSAVGTEAGQLINAFPAEPGSAAAGGESAQLIGVFVAEQAPGYPAGYTDGERSGFSSLQETEMYPIRPGETDPDKKIVDFYIYTVTGLPASGALGEGAVFVPSVGEVQVNRDLAGYVNSAGTFAQISDYKYRYTFSDAEIAGSTEGNIWIRLKRTGYRTVVRRVPLRLEPPSAAMARDAILDAARSGHIGTGTIGEGVAAAMALLQGNFYMDQTTNTASGQTAARIRCFH